MAENEWTTGKGVLKINGVPFDFEITVPAKPIKPHRMLPIFQQMANSLTDIGVQAVENEGKSVSCKAGCGACCRQPVPISEIEVYQIAELVEAMPEPRRTVIRKRFADGIDHFRNIGLLDDLKEHYNKARAKGSRKEAEEALSVVLKYFYEGIPCPFLENESCSIHQNRPIACREYLVTSPAANCAKPTAETVKLVQLPIKPSKTVAKLGPGAMRDEGLTLLIMALELAGKYPEDLPEKTGQEWMADFLSHLANGGAEQNKSREATIRSTKKKRKRKGKGT